MIYTLSYGRDSLDAEVALRRIFPGDWGFLSLGIGDFFKFGYFYPEDWDFFKFGDFYP